LFFFNRWYFITQFQQMQALFRYSGDICASKSSGIFTLKHQHGPLYADTVQS
jgi:hypothetical protein